MACVALARQIDGIFLQVPRVVLEEVGQEVYEMIGRLWRVVNNWVSVVGRKSDPDWLIQAHQMSEMVPSPHVLDRFVGTVQVLNINWAHFVEASELRGSSRPPLQPDNERYGVVLPA